jgi:hypothetical protein
MVTSEQPEGFERTKVGFLPSLSLLLLCLSW